MARLRIVPLKSERRQFATDKGKLFEQLVRDVLRRDGYRIVETPRVNYAGMEIDIEGTHTISGHPFIAECKAHQTPLDAPSLQAFVGKWFNCCQKDSRLHGVFIALPGINSHARGFWNETTADPSRGTLVLLEEEAVIDHLVQTGLASRSPSTGRSPVAPEDAVLGDSVLAATDFGYFWLQLLLRRGQTTPSLAVVIGSDGQPLPDGDLLRSLVDRVPELEGLTIVRPSPPLAPTSPLPPDSQAADEVASVKGSSAWFEYQFPASPQFFVGREQAIDDFRSFVTDVRAGSTSARGFLIQANSGWGKSSLILKLKEAVAGEDCLLIPIDSRAASTPYFPLRATDYVLSEAVKAGYLSLPTDSLRIGGMSSLTDVLTRVADQLHQTGRLLCIAFDQFEGIFATPTMLENIARLASMVTDLGGPILLCFAWKTDLVGPTHDFPYQTRDHIAKRCHTLILERFGETETDELLEALEQELHRKLAKHLAFLLRESSQGYPWLLKKLCAHVLTHIESGARQVDLATQMLRIKELFDADLSGLSPREEEALRNLARVAPVASTDVGEIASADVFDSLIDNRLVVRVGTKYDVYWDIFRDYLNTGALPVEESFILRSSVGSALSALDRIRGAGPAGLVLEPSSLGVSSRGTVYNLVRDLQLLGLIRVHDGRVKLAFHAPYDEPLELSLQKPVQDKMRRHRIARSLLDQLDESEPLSLDQLANTVRQMCPYITADEKTWSTYARILSKWLQVAQLVTFEPRYQVIRRFDPLTDLGTAPWAFSGLARRKGPFIPEVQYQRLEAAMLDIGDAIANQQSHVTITRLSRSAWRKAVHVATELGFLESAGNVIRVTDRGGAFISTSEQRSALFRRQATETIPAYVEFVRIISNPATKHWSLCQLGQELSRRLHTTWAESTATWAAKILTNWAKAAGQVANVRRPARPPASTTQLQLGEVTQHADTSSRKPATT